MNFHVLLWYVMYGWMFSMDIPEKTVQPILAVSDSLELSDVKNVVFATGLRDWKNKRVDSLVMDIYYPTGATADKKYPLLMFYHAGGFNAGNRFNVMAICDRFADQGFITAAIEYRLGYQKRDGKNCNSDSATYNNAVYRAVQDANAATRFLVANAEQYNIDTSWIFIAGSSAGASLALAQAYWSDSTAQIYNPESYNLLGSLETSGNNYANSFSVKGVCAMWGTLGHADDLIDTTYRAIPSIVFKGEEDGGNPDSAGHFGYCKNMPYVYAGVAIYHFSQLQQTPCVFHYLPKAKHPAYDKIFCVENAACFFRKLMRGETYSGKFENFTMSCPQ